MSAIIAVFFLLFPLFFLPVTTEFYEINKLVLLIATDALLIILSGIRVIKNKKINITGSTFLIPLTLISLIYLISALFQSPNVAVALTTPMSVSGIISGLILYVLLTAFIQDNQKERLIHLIEFDAIIISLFLLLMYLGFIPTSVTTPAGNLLSSAIFIFSILVYISIRCYQIVIKNMRLKYLITNYRLIFYLFSLLIIIPSFMAVSYHLSTDQNPIILPWKYGWMILLKIGQNIKSLILGVGPANFLTAFTLGRPVEINQTPFWNITFTSSSSFFLTMATETGIAAVSIYIYILIKSVFLTVKAYISKSVIFPMAAVSIIILIIQIILPGNFTVFILSVILLAFCAKKYSLADIKLNKIMPVVYLTSLALFCIIAVIVYFSGRFFLADVYFNHSLTASVQGNGSKMYNLQRQGLILNPYLDRYHVTFSQTSLRLANALAAKKDLSDTDRQNIPKLVSQSIEEARTAVRLYPTSTVNWDNLTLTYSQLINFATGSAQWAVQSAGQKISLDPTSPNPRLSMGLLQVTLNNLPEAEKYLLEAIALKPDLIAAHFNLAKVYKLGKKYDLAREEFQKTKSLLPPESQDHKTIDAELKELSSSAPGV